MPEPTEEQRASQTASMAAMLAAEQSFQNGLRAAIAIAMMLPSLGSDRRRIDQLAAAVRAAAERATLAGRLAAKTASHHALAGEFTTALADLDALEQATGLEFAGHDEQDNRRAAYVGASVANKWRNGALAALATGETLRQAKQTATARRMSQLELIATTETATAFNIEREIALQRYAAANPTALYQPFLRWDAALDRRTCFRCEDMDGEVVAAADGWKGDGPGAIHPRCRCVDTVVMLPAYAVAA